MRWGATIVAVVCGCYRPAGEMACTVSCDTAGEPCPGGLVCGDDHLCFAETPCSQLDASTDAAHCAPSTTDLDGDCIPDAVDACIAPASDAAGDLDGDLMPNGVDPCPLDDQSLAPGDIDGDGIPNVCDPSSLEDRVRCVMAFTDPVLSRGLWISLHGNPRWTFSAGHAMGAVAGVGIASMLSPYSLEGNAVTTYDLVAHVPAGVGVLTVWLRAGGSRDLGCEIDTTQTQPTLGIAGSGTATPLPFSMDLTSPATLRIRAKVSVQVPTSVTCSLTVEQVTATTVVLGNDEMLPDGTFGITTSGHDTTIDGIVIFDRK